MHHVHQNRGPSVDQPVEASVVNLAIQPSPTITTFTSTGHFITGPKCSRAAWTLQWRVHTMAEVDEQD